MKVHGKQPSTSHNCNQKIRQAERKHTLALLFVSPHSPSKELNVGCFRQLNEGRTYLHSILHSNDNHYSPLSAPLHTHTDAAHIE